MPDSNALPDLGSRFRLDGKVVVITGATGILGGAYCRGFAQAGARVIASDLSLARCEELGREINAQHPASVVPLEVDLRDEQSVAGWAAVISKQFGGIDVLINNAAAKSPRFFAPLPDFPLADWNEVMAVNLTGMFLAIRALGPAMAERGRGSIVNVSSIYGVVGPDQRVYEGSNYPELGGAINTPLVYSASKGAVIAMTRYLATYWGPRGVRCNTLTPGGVESGQNETFRQKYCDRVPLGRMGEKLDLLCAALFLASDASSYINGHNLIVDGGWTAW
jgi:NAD(P)-dependent dehydrogenase (short-subunit alcohol dehydrogenase family)